MANQAGLASVTLPDGPTDDGAAGDIKPPLTPSEGIEMVRDAIRKMLSVKWNQDVAPDNLRDVTKALADEGWTSLSLGDDDMGLEFSLVVVGELGRVTCPA